MLSHPLFVRCMTGCCISAAQASAVYSTTSMSAAVAILQLCVRQIADISTFVVACRLMASMPPRALVDYSSDPDDVDDDSNTDGVGKHGQTSDAQTTVAAKRRRVEMPSIPSSVLQMPSLLREVMHVHIIITHGRSRGKAVRERCCSASRQNTRGRPCRWKLAHVRLHQQ